MRLPGSPGLEMFRARGLPLVLGAVISRSILRDSSSRSTTVSASQGHWAVVAAGLDQYVRQVTPCLVVRHATAPLDVFDEV